MSRSGTERWTIWVCPECGSIQERPTDTGKCRGFLHGPTHNGPPRKQERIEVVPATRVQELEAALERFAARLDEAAHGTADAFEAETYADLADEARAHLARSHSKGEA